MLNLDSNMKFKHLLIFLFSYSFSFAQNIDYIENKGQWNSNIKYEVNIQGGTIFIEENSLTFNYIDSDQLNKLHLESNLKPEISVDAFAYKVDLLNSNTTPNFKPFNKKEKYHNYFIGNNSNKWKSKVPIYSEVIVEEVYNKIDMKLHSIDTYFKYDFIVEPEGNTNQILLSYNHIKPSLENGKLIFDIGFNKVIEQTPIAYQIIDNKTCYVSQNLF